jgi:pimeloyl-ACP methyl ester carboxylesterase
MAHGMGGTREAGLDGYARRFSGAGLAVLAFDYRHLGQSDGEPRQLIWIPYQLEDYAAAIAFGRSRGEIDPERIALWGSSLSGGHVIVAAARDPRVACVSAQCPALDGHAAAHANYAAFGFRRGARLIMHAQRDLIRSWLGLSAHRIPIAGGDESIALMPAAEAYEAFCRLTPVDFVNEACARILIRQDKYRPVRQAHKVRCPVLLLVCDKDPYLPGSAVEQAAKRLGDLAEVRRYPIGHFDIYFGENFNAAVEDQVAFFTRHLLRRHSACSQGSVSYSIDDITEHS